MAIFANQENIETIKSAKEKQKVCTDQFIEHVNTLKLWEAHILTYYSSQTMTVILYKDNANCQQNDVSRLQRAIATPTEASDQAKFLTDDYKAQSEETDKSTQTSIQNNSDYQKEYFGNLGQTIDNQFHDLDLDLPTVDPLYFGNLSSEINQLADCMSMSADNNCDGGVYDQWQTSSQVFNQSKQDVENLLASTDANIKSFKTQAEQDLDQMRSYMQQMEDVSDWIKRSSPPNFNLNLPPVPSFCGDINAESSCKATLINFNPDLPTTEISQLDFPEVNIDASKLTEPAKGAVQSAADGAKKTSLDTEIYLSTISIGLNETFFDTNYNPPPIDFSADLRAQQRDDWYTKMNSILGEINSYTNFTSESNGTEYMDAVGNLNFDLSTIPDFGYLPFDGRSIPIPDFLDVGINFSSFVTFADLGYRICLSLWIATKYWTMTAVGLPVIDIRKWKESVKKISYSQSSLDYEQSHHNSVFLRFLIYCLCRNCCSILCSTGSRLCRRM